MIAGHEAPDASTHIPLRRTGGCKTGQGLQPLLAVLHSLMAIPAPAP